ncbi:GntR family transcriptional regulator [Georgenia ruanii]|uniref:GntR family transcriptional regulator n=1 Tax=Georgenia ruanii TaxID=348442 RepID=A0A7J9UZL8_9MICO|nr:GntR family transcriptional regulator [Georgenia ruanii]MPV90091.1 GntR family transcriptional regulator [Georgenia ruanii]
MSAGITLDLSSGVPPYEQIRAQVSALVAAGTLIEGARLPTVRDLAADLGIAPGTVQRAYRELEARGVVRSRRRAGTVVAMGAGGGAAAAVQGRARDFVRGARAAGLDDDGILDLVRGALMTA